MALQIKASKGMANEMNAKESVGSSLNTTNNNNINAPKYGTVIPNRVFVGGLSSATTESDLAQLFSNYGNVIATKIIADRAGVSKGYGFVTFETEDEAKRLQKDAENIVLRERRLNIAPAIRKQGFTRNTYEAAQTGATSPITMPANQVFRQNGVTFTFHNGMAFFPQQALQPQPPSPVTPIQNHVEPTSVYTTGNPYGGIAQASTPSAFPFSYAPQGQIFYHTAHYPYHVPIESCYLGEGHNGVMMPTQTSGESGGVIIPAQYYITQSSPQTELTYYNPQSQVTQISIPSQENVPQIIYATPRSFEPNPSPILYSEHNGVENSTSVTNITSRTEEVEINTRTACDTPCNNRNRDNGASARGRGKGSGQVKGRKVSSTVTHRLNDNNNNADVHNKNSCAVSTTTTTIRSRRSPAVQHFNKISTPQSIRPNPSQCPVQVPQFPYYSSAPRQFFTSAPPPTRRPFCTRNKYSTRGRTKWYNRDSIIESGMEENGCITPNTLTPPITPRSPQGAGTNQADDVLNSVETLTI